MLDRLPLETDERSPPRVRSLVAALRRIVLDTPADTLIGRESELCLRLACNQGMLRQVARQLEVQGLLYIRRGPSGGYFASRPVERTVIDLAALYLVGVGTTLRDALLACRGMAVDAVNIAASRVDGGEASRSMRNLVAELRAQIPEDMGSETFIAGEERIDQAIFDVVGIKALQMFINMLNLFSLKEFGQSMFERQPERRRLYRDERLRTLEAILAADGDAAQQSMRRVVDMIEKWLPSEAIDRPVGRDIVLVAD